VVNVADTLLYKKLFLRQGDGREAAAVYQLESEGLFVIKLPVFHVDCEALGLVGGGLYLLQRRDIRGISLQANPALD